MLTLCDEENHVYRVTHIDGEFEDLGSLDAEENLHDLPSDSESDLDCD
jgi:hypothetical protein